MKHRLTIAAAAIAALVASATAAAADPITLLVTTALAYVGVTGTIATVAASIISAVIVTGSGRGIRRLP